MSGTICKTCDDTHTMTLGEREVPCTFCPVPCESCRAPREGYCRNTPCSCSCHGLTNAAATEFERWAERKRRHAVGFDVARDRAKDVLDRADTMSEAELRAAARALAVDVFSVVDRAKEYAREISRGLRKMKTKDGGTR